MDATISLADRLKTAVHRGFAPRARYYAHGDFVTYFIAPERCLARRVNSLITVYTDAKSGDLVGCKVKGISQLMRKLQMAWVFVGDGKVTLGLLFLSTLMLEDEKKQEVLDLASKFGQAELPLEEICDQAA